MSGIAVEVFSFVGDYATEIEESKSLLTEFGEDDGLVWFCREFFNQFLAAEFEVRIDYFSSKRATDAWIKIKPNLKKDDPRAPIVAAFREFCQDYDTIIGEHYEKGGELTAFQDATTRRIVRSRASSAPVDSFARSASRPGV